MGQKRAKAIYTMEQNQLFSEFQPISAKQWKQKIQYDLKGADYNQSLVWESLEGISVKPFYTAEDVAEIPKFSLPKAHSWKIGQSVYTKNPIAAHKKAKDVLARGAQSLSFRIVEPRIDWNALLNGLELDNTPLHLHFDFLDFHCVQRLKDWLAEKPITVFLNIDIIGHLARTGTWFSNQVQDHAQLDQLVALTNPLPQVSAIAIDTTLYQNAGANMVQQLAYSLAHGNEYLNHFDQKLNNTIEKPVVFQVAVGSNYFFEIAKIRALRWLWHSLTNSYNLKQPCQIWAVPSKRNKTVYDYNVNMLRTTTECMSAVLGGADVICNQPYDTLFHKENEFGDRIARNQLLLLKEEAYFDEAQHAANGTYFIEVLTHQLAEKALGLFKQIEATGGFVQQLKEGNIQRKIKESAAKEQALFEEGKIVLLGTNKFENTTERMAGELELYPFVKNNKRKTEIEPIIEKRWAESLEKRRLEQEK